MDTSDEKRGGGSGSSSGSLSITTTNLDKIASTTTSTLNATITNLDDITPPASTTSTSKPATEPLKVVIPRAPDAVGLGATLHKLGTSSKKPAKKSREEWRIDLKNIRISTMEVLGHGKYGVVYKGYYKNEVVAVKTFEKSNEEAHRLLEVEFDLMAKMNTPTAVRLIGYIEKPFMVVLEYVNGGDLEVYMNTHEIGPMEKLEISIGMAQALVHLHEANIIHRDIKPSNFLIDYMTRQVKLADFGVSRLLNRHMDRISSSIGRAEDVELSRSTMTTYVGTPRYVALKYV